MTVPAQELSTDDVSGSKQVELLEEQIRSSGSDSPVSGAASEQHLPDNKDSSSTQDNYANIGLVRDSSPSYAPSEPQQQDSHDMPGFAVCVSFQFYHRSLFVVEFFLVVYANLSMTCSCLYYVSETLAMRGLHSQTSGQALCL